MARIARRDFLKGTGVVAAGLGMAAAAPAIAEEAEVELASCKPAVYGADVIIVGGGIAATTAAQNSPGFVVDNGTFNRYPCLDIERKGVDIFDRTMVTELIMDDDGCASAVTAFVAFVQERLETQR